MSFQSISSMGLNISFCINNSINNTHRKKNAINRSEKYESLNISYDISLCVPHTADADKTLQEQLPLIVGSLTAGLVFIIVVVVIAIVCLR